MKEYTVLKVKCKKGIKIADIYDYVRETLHFDRNFFALQNIELGSISKQCRTLYDELDLDKFFYKVVLKHLKEHPNYDPQRDDRKMISNLDSCWNWYNEKENESLSKDAFEKMIAFCDALKTSDISSLILGMDEIRWDGKATGQGTYGYQKAAATYDLGKNYLSNSIIVGRIYDSKTYTVHISFEKRFGGLDVINNLVDFLGEKKTEMTYYAPENRDERVAWEAAAEEANIKFQNALAGLKCLELETIERRFCKDDENKKINIKRYINDYLCTDGWKIRKAYPDEWPTIISKEKEESEICLSIMSGDKGHHLQSLIYYRNKRFFFGDHIHNLHCNDLAGQEEAFFRNAKIIRDYLYEVL